MKMTRIRFQLLRCTGLVISALVSYQIALAQLTPIWTVNHGQITASAAQGSYYSNLAGAPSFTAAAPTISFNWGQSLPIQDLTSVRLIDPLQTRSVPQAQLPPDLETRVRAGLLPFPSLPPQLETRVTYDPIARRLQFHGEFVEPPAGESYLLLNVLTARERVFLASLTSDSAWQTAVAGLAAQAASLVDVPPDSNGFDSLALTAGDAEGTGYVTLAFGNSTNLSAPSEPISLNVIKVLDLTGYGPSQTLEAIDKTTQAHKRAAAAHRQTAAIYQATPRT